MAELQIQKKESSGWIWWVVGLLILAALAWWFFGDRTPDTAINNQTDAMAPAAMAPISDQSAITDLSMLTGSGDMLAVMDRPVVLMNTPVTSVVSDKGFWAGSGTAVGEGVFVVRGNQDASYTAPNGAVEAGRPVNIYGHVQRMPAELSQQTTSWNLAATDSALLSTHRIYVQADSVRLSNP